MSKKIVIAALLGALAMFVWISIAHMVIPLAETGVRQISGEEPLLAQMAVLMPEQGLYLFPNMPPSNDQAAYYKKISTGPSGFLVYFPKREFVFGQVLGVEFLTELAQVLLAVWLLSVTGFSTFAGRLSFFAVLGLLVAISTNVSYWNWYGFPGSYTLASMFTEWMGFLCAGAVAAAMKIGGR